MKTYDAFPFVAVLFALIVALLVSTCGNERVNAQAAPPSDGVSVIQLEQNGFNEFGTYVVVIADNKTGDRYATVCNRGCGKLVRLEAKR